MSARAHPSTVDELAKKAGVSRRTMFQAIKVHRAGCDEVIKAVMNGSISLHLAVEIAAFDVNSQRDILSEALRMPSKRRLSFVQILRGGTVHACTAAAGGA